jgi:hypothetical protein
MPQALVIGHVCYHACRGDPVWACVHLLTLEVTCSGLTCAHLPQIASLTIGLLGMALRMSVEVCDISQDSRRGFGGRKDMQLPPQSSRFICWGPGCFLNCWFLFGKWKCYI